MSKHLTGRHFHELSPFGINCLTGEACRVGVRVLCDVTERGQRIVCDLLGLPRDTRLAENWNRGGIGSFMIPRDLFLMLGVWCLFDDGAIFVVAGNDGSMVGFYPEDDRADMTRLLESWRDLGLLDRTYSIPQAIPGQGTRAEHAMSGRVA